jgi:hypothetical protein
MNMALHLFPYQNAPKVSVSLLLILFFVLKVVQNKMIASFVSITRHQEIPREVTPQK